MAAKGAGTLIVIGGHEDRTGEKRILAEVARRVEGGKLVLIATASEQPEDLFEEYQKAFRSLGLRHVHSLSITERGEAKTESRVRVLSDATGVFFTGGDQVRLTSQLGDTPIFQRIQEIHQAGGVVAGTSAGASVMCETMIVSGNGEESARTRDGVNLAPGFGLVSDLVIDQHFAERGRLGRLLAAVAQNPKILGIGIDENTAIVLRRRRFTVLGESAVYVVDGSPVTSSNASDTSIDSTLSMFDLKLHLLSEGDTFDIEKRRPNRPERPALELNGHAEKKRKLARR